MTITNGYLTLPEAKAWTGVSDNTADTAILERLVEAASRSIDNACQRHFWQATATTRTFVADDRYCLTLGAFCDLVSVTSIKTDAAGDGTFETTWSASDYQLLPHNPSAAPEQRPYTSVKAVGSNVFPLPSGRARDDRVQIVGTFGWPAVPKDIVQACGQLTARLYQRKDSPSGVFGFGGDGGTVRVSRIDPDILALVEPYILLPVMVA